MSLFNIKSEFKATVGNATHQREVTNEQVYYIADDMHTAISQSAVTAPTYNALSDDDKARLACDIVDYVQGVWRKTDTPQWANFDEQACYFYNNLPDYADDDIDGALSECQSLFNDWYGYYSKESVLAGVLRTAVGFECSLYQ